MTKECPQTSVLRDDLISRAAVLNTLTELSCNDNAHWGVIIDAIRALPAVTASQQQVRVKPLEWIKQENGEWRVTTIIGSYGANKVGWWRLSDRNATLSDDPKAAAQADYEQRILAAIETQPDPRDAVIAQLVDAAEAQLQYMDMCGDKGDLERNLRSALFAVKGLKNE